MLQSEETLQSVTSSGANLTAMQTHTDRGPRLRWQADRSGVGVTWSVFWLFCLSKKGLFRISPCCRALSTMWNAWTSARYADPGRNPSETAFFTHWKQYAGIVSSPALDVVADCFSLFCSSCTRCWASEWSCRRHWWSGRASWWSRAAKAPLLLCSGRIHFRVYFSITNHA